MIKSIQQFQIEGVKNLEKVFMNYSSDMTKIAEMVKGVKERVINLGLSMIAEELEMYDEFLNIPVRQHRKSGRRETVCLGLRKPLMRVYSRNVLSKP